VRHRITNTIGSTGTRYRILIWVPSYYSNYCLGEARVKRQKNWYADNKFKITLFHTVLTPIYIFFKKIFDRSIIMIVCPIVDEGSKDARKYRKTHDFIRHRTLGFVADELKRRMNSNYCIAEVGVFRGDFAARIQNEFLDKPFYLFDTFEGFPADDKALDLQEGFSSKETHDKIQFESTSVDLVLSKMPRPEACRICKGYFPATVVAEYQKLSWGFVSLDVDLYKPTLEALRFFYPRLLPGGVIMIHDYNSPEFSGVKQAVDEFEAEVGRLIKVPIPDAGGSLVIAK